VTTTTTTESSERVAQRREALQAIDAMIARGQWGSEERRKFHEELGILDPPQPELALQKLASAINSGSIHADAVAMGLRSD